ncbi:MAG: hypothetical protein ACOVSR_15360 [Bacteroidia bacterium]
MKQPRTIKHFILLSISLLSINVFAQKTETIKHKHALGAGAGFTTGYGLSYRYIPNKFGVQVNFAPYKSESITRFSTGLTFLYQLMETDKTALYLYQANHYYSNSNSAAYNQVTGLYDKKEEEAYFNNGLGFGFEVIIVKNIGFNLMTGYALYQNAKNYNVTGEAALYFKF